MGFGYVICKHQASQHGKASHLFVPSCELFGSVSRLKKKIEVENHCQNLKIKGKITVKISRLKKRAIAEEWTHMGRHLKKELRHIFSIILCCSRRKRCCKSFSVININDATQTRWMPCLAAREQINSSAGLATDLAQIDPSSLAAACCLNDPFFQLGGPPRHYQAWGCGQANKLYTQCLLLLGSPSSVPVDNI